MFGYFYNKSLRSTVVAFGSLFNNVIISKRDSNDNITEYIRVPLSYGAKEKFIQRINSASSISDGTKVEITLPRMGFELTDISYDPTRKRTTLSKKFNRSQTSQSANSYMYAEVPYDVSFNLSVFTRNMDDLLQIIEQITPYFTPEFSVSINFNELNMKTDVPITLNSVSIEEDYEGSFDTTRLLTASMNFTAKLYMFGPTKTSTTILRTESVIFQDAEIVYGIPGSTYEGLTGALSRVDVGVSGSSADIENFLIEGLTLDYYKNVYVSGVTGSTAGPGIDLLGNTI